MACGSRRERQAALLMVGLALQGCASPGRPVTQTLRVETPGCARVACELSNDLGRWDIPRTPGAVTLTTSSVTLRVSCRADDGSQGGTGAASSSAPTTGGGAVAGGVAGGVAVGAAFGATALAFIPPLGLIALATGVAGGAVTGKAIESRQRSLHYPELISVPMSCPDAAQAVAPTGAALGLVIRGLRPSEMGAGTAAGQGGVLVASVAERGDAAAAGLRSGDIVLAAGGQDLRDAADLEARLLALAPRMSLALRVSRDGRVLELMLTRTAAQP